MAQFFPEKADEPADTAHPFEPEEVRRLEQKIAALKAQSARYQRHLAALQQSDTEKKARFAPSGLTPLNRGELDMQSSEEKQTSGGAALCETTSNTHSASKPYDGPARRLFAASPLLFASPIGSRKLGREISVSPSTVTGDLAHLGVVSAAANSSRHLADASGLAIRVLTPADVYIGAIIEAPFAATALDRRPECDPTVNAKFVQANGFCLQACFRKFVVVAVYEHCIKAIPVESAGGRGPNRSRTRNGAVILLSPHHRIDGTYSVEVNMVADPLKTGSFVDLTQDRPINFKEKIAVVGKIHAGHLSFFMDEWHRVNDDRRPRKRPRDENDELEYPQRHLSSDNAQFRARENRFLVENDHLRNSQTPFNHPRGRYAKRQELTWLTSDDYTR